MSMKSKVVVILIMLVSIQMVRNAIRLVHTMDIMRLNIMVEQVIVIVNKLTKTDEPDGI